MGVFDLGVCGVSTSCHHYYTSAREVSEQLYEVSEQLYDFSYNQKALCPKCLNRDFINLWDMCLSMQTIYMAVKNNRHF
eukprot:4214392-Ditylum_brightwellii.AAC.1